MKGQSDVGDSLTGLASVLSELTASLVEPVLQRHGLGFGAFDLLSAVHAADGRESQTQIAARLGISPPSLTEAIQSAVKKGLIEQLVVATNQRARRVMITDKGKAILQECLDQITRAESLATQGLSAAELDQAKASLRRATNSLIQALSGSVDNS